MQESVLIKAYFDYKTDLERFLSRRLGCSSLAADLAHDIYLKLRNMRDDTPVDNLRSYLFGMAANLANDHQKIERRRHEILEEGKAFDVQETDDLSPERHAMGQAELAYLSEAMNQLNPRCRRVFYLNRFEGLTQTEIAQQLGIGLTTVHKDLKTVITTMLTARRRFQRHSDFEDMNKAND